MSVHRHYLSTQTGIGGSVYIIDADHGVKIGVTRWPDPTERTLDISRTAGMEMRIIRAWTFGTYQAACRVEREAHAALAADRTIGEWFHCHPLEACATVERIIANIDREYRERLAS